MFLCSFFLFHLRPQFVPDDLKDDKYWARRRKNNMAAKRSRDARRMKENQIALRAGFLEKEVNFLTAGNLKSLRRLYLPCSYIIHYLKTLPKIFVYLKIYKMIQTVTIDY